MKSKTNIIVNFWTYMLFISMILLFSCTNTDTKPDLSKAFIKYYGGSSGDIISKVVPTSDGGYVIVGTSGSFKTGLSDIYVVKTDRNGDTQWARNYGDFGADSGKAIKELPDGTFIVAGGWVETVSGTAFSNSKIALLKLSRNGDTLWTRKFGRDNQNAIAYDIDIDSDGSILIGASVYYELNSRFTRQLYVLRVNSNGNLSGSVDPYGPAGISTYITTILKGDSPGEIDFFGTSGTIFSGNALSEVNYSPIIGRLNSSGNLSGTLDKLAANLNIPRANGSGEMKRIGTEGYIIVGAGINDKSNLFEPYLVKLDKSKTRVGGYNTYGNPNLNGYFISVNTTSDGGFIAVGAIQTSQLDFDWLIVKTNADGVQEWMQTYGAPGPNSEQAVSVSQTADGGYIIGGEMSLQNKQGANTNIVMCLIKTNAEGKISQK